MLAFKCRFKGHVPGDRIVRNAGHGFARCTRCGADIVETDGKWSVPPKGARIVWTDAERRQAAEAAEAAEADRPAPPSRREAVSDRRRAEDRRKKKGPLPAFLAGKDRRSGQRDRRTAFGRRFRG